ncbi:MAG: RNA polymerase sporulation sigma factor SigE [Ruminococcus sp.]|nr:RNA polymerase sporulation sigma factor SigE [Candidatus Apopatosoma intestinale]
MFFLKIRRFLARLFSRNPGEVEYIGNAELLPPPLTPEEEEEILRLLDVDRNNRRKLVERNLRLVVYIAKKFENTGIELEDLISIGTIGLIKAANTFDPNKNIKLATYASRCIENEILMYIRKISNTKTELSFDEPLSTDWDGNELLLSDVLGDEESVGKNLEEDEDKKTIARAVASLSDRERQIVELRFGLYGHEERTQKEVADMLGISQSYISRLEKKIIEHLRAEMMGKI